MLGNYFTSLTRLMLNFTGISLIGLMTASQGGGGWASLESVAGDS